MGGDVSFTRLKQFLKPCLERKNVFVTTFIDLYGSKNLPAYQDSLNKNCLYEKMEFLEKSLYEQINQELKCGNKFIPYIQPYEIEALLFSDITKFSYIPNVKDKQIDALYEIRQKFDTPEHINNSEYTAPSKRIKSIIKNYNKPLHGKIITEQIGLEKIKQECKHFASWLEILKSLNT